MNQTYIEWLHPGSFCSESTILAVDDRTPPKHLPPRTYGYRFFERREIVIECEILVGAKKNFSPITYFGTRLSLGQVRDIPGTGVLRSNMEMNKWDHVVQTAYGNFYPLHEGDVVLAPVEETI